MCLRKPGNLTDKEKIMCFTNKATKLADFREEKTPIKVWKRVGRSEKSGEFFSNYDTKKTHTVWEQGKTVKPHIVRKPLRDGQEAGAGLYFYTDKEDVHKSHHWIEALVNPKDIIAVNYNGSMICCTEAVVTKTPAPITPQKARAKWLRKQLEAAKRQIERREQQAERWKYEKADQHEAIQQMKDEIKQMKGAK